MLLDTNVNGDEVEISYFNNEGKTVIEKYKTEFGCSNWVVCNERDPKRHEKITNWDGRPVKRARSKFLNKYSLIEFFEDLNQKETDTVFADSMPNTYFIDIEVEIGDGFPAPERAEMPVTTICIVTPNKQAVVLATKEIDYKSKVKIQKQVDKHFEQVGLTFNVNYKAFASEYDMLYTFFKHFVRKMPMMSGWNVIDFDWVYLVNRARKISIDPRIASPVNKLQGYQQLPMHVGIIDYMRLYKEWDRTIQVKEDYRLDTAGDAVVGIKKVKYDGSLQDLYEKDYDKYVFYNIADTALVYLIHEKLKTMEIVLTLANMCKMSIYKASSPVSITESLILRHLLTQDKVMAKDWNASSEKDAQYAGAYVKKPTVGFHRGVAGFDYASLYPSIMRQFNISPDSLLLKTDPEFDKLREPLKEHLIKPGMKRLSKEKRKELIDNIEEDKIITVTGAVYKKEDSILKSILSDLYSNRKQYKSKSFQYKLAVADVENFIKKKYPNSLKK
jgi:DNA polymerase elongation subunit (family B)